MTKNNIISSNKNTTNITYYISSLITIVISYF